MKAIKHLVDSRRRFKGSYLLRFQVALIGSLSIFLVLFKIDIRPAEEEAAFVVAEQEIFVMEESIQTQQKTYAPPPPRPTVPIEVPNDEVIEDEIIMIDSELNLDDFVAYLPPPPKPVQDEEAVEEQIFVVVEQPPVLIGGFKELQSKIVYPDIAIEAGIEGRVIVQFVIDKEGNVTNPFVVRGIGGGCDEEALRVVKLAKFTPAMQRGKPVLLSYTIPIIFKIGGESSR